MLNYKQIWHGIKPTKWLIKINLTVIIYQKLKENKTLIYLSKNLSLEARLQNGKVLGTHFAVLESGLLDSND